MTETNQVISELLDLCRSKGVRSFKSGTFEAEFFPSKPEPMNFDPVELSKNLGPSMPPDSAMLFASSEGIPSEEPASESV